MKKKNKTVVKGETVAEVRGLHLAYPGVSKTEVRTGDSIILSLGKPSNLQIYREERTGNMCAHRMNLYTGQGLPWPDKDKVYTLSEALMLAVGLSVASGLNFRKEKVADGYYAFAFFKE